MVSTYAIRQATARWVLRLTIINLVVFVVERFVPGFFNIFGLVPSLVIRGWLWQVVTYLFVHANLLHLFFNMIVLWFIGTELERYWGSAYFIKYYLVTGVGAGLITIVSQPSSGIPTIGASGAIFGLIMGFALAFPDREIWLYFVIRMKARHLATLLGFIEVLFVLTNPGGRVARFAHLGGLLVGYIYLKHDRLLLPLRGKLHHLNISIRRRSLERRLEKQAQISAEIDRILDKIARDGLQSLTEKERRFLEKQGKPK